MSKKKTAIAKAIKHIAEVREKMTSSSQILGLTQAMDVLEEYKELEKNQIRKAFNQGYKWASEIGSEEYFNQDYTQSSE